MRTKKLKVIKTTPVEEQELKNLEFLKLSPSQRLRIHEQLRKRIWGNLYNKTRLKGLKVVKRFIQQ
jgi:hypothetical protein